MENARNRPLPPLDLGIPPEMMRERGLMFCEQGYYETCLDFLDRAAARDPKQNEHPAVIKWRAVAAKAMHAREAPKAP